MFYYPNATQDDYTELEISLLPTGRAWNTDKESNLRRLLSGFAGELARTHNLACSAAIEANPSGLNETLETREIEAGLPDACTSAAETFPERKSRVVSKWTYSGGASRAYFQNIAQSIGYVGVIITELPTPYHWKITIPAAGKHTFFEFRNSEFGDYFDDSVSGGLECILNRLKPCHTVLTFEYI